MKHWIRQISELWHTAVKLRPHLRGGRSLAAAVFASSLMSAALEGVGVGLLVPMLSLLLGGDNPTPMRPLVWLQEALPGRTAPFYVVVLCGVILGAIAAKNLILYLSQVLAARLKRRISVNLRDALYGRLIGAHLEIFEKRGAGEMANLFLTETFRTINTVDFLLLLLQRASIGFCYLIVLVLISWKLTLLTVALAVGIAALVAFLYRRLVRSGRELSQRNQEMGACLMDGFAGIRVIRATFSQAGARERFRTASEAQARVEERSARMSHLLQPISETVAVMGAMGIVAMAYYFLIEPGLMLPSYLLGFGVILLRLLPLMSQIYGLQGHLLYLAGSVREVQKWMEAPQFPGTPFGERELREVRKGIRLDHVSFGYSNRAFAVEDLTFEIPAGQVVALVGQSGSGKSTVAGLLLRFRQPSGGRILVDDTDYWEFSPESWHRAVALVEQEAFLFHDTFANNVSFGCNEATREAILDAVRVANLEDVVESLPNGLETIVGERGTMLSGGQRQRLAIARALVRQPKILILDEATSALDSLSEQQVQAALQRASAGRMVLIIAHRMSTIRHANRIVVLANGRLVEDGTWDELRQEAGLFAELSA